MSVFQSTLFRNDQYEGSPTKDMKPTIVAAPAANLLKLFGGTLTHEEFRKKYDELGLMHTVYSQKIPAGDDDSNEKLESVKGHPTDWFCLYVPADSKSSNEYLGGLHAWKSEIPRNLNNTIEFLRKSFSENLPKVDEGECHAFTVVVHPEKKNIFAICDPQEWKETINKLGTRLLGKQDLFGDAIFFTKTIPNLNKKKSVKKIESSLAESQAVPAATTPGTTATTTTATDVNITPNKPIKIIVKTPKKQVTTVMAAKASQVKKSKSKGSSEKKEIKPKRKADTDVEKTDVKKQKII